MDTFKLDKRKNSVGDFVVKCYCDGKRCTEGDYYTNDWEDAQQTFAKLKEQAYLRYVQGIIAH